MYDRSSTVSLSTTAPPPPLPPFKSQYIMHYFLTGKKYLACLSVGKKILTLAKPFNHNHPTPPPPPHTHTHTPQKSMYHALLFDWKEISALFVSREKILTLTESFNYTPPPPPTHTHSMRKRSAPKLHVSIIFFRTQSTSSDHRRRRTTWYYNAL